MWVLFWLSLVVLLLALLPCLMVLRNLSLYRPPTEAERAAGADAKVSVLIPARDEARNIEAAVRAALAASEGVAAVEVVVLDDHSEDGTGAIVRSLAEADPRVRLEHAPALPDGWNGKQHACAVLAGRVGDRFDTLVFVDADVRLRPGALAGLAGFLRTRPPGPGGEPVTLASGVPRQCYSSLPDVLIIPQILLFLLGYLPIDRMRKDPGRSFGVGCGQLFVADRSAYVRSGGHTAIRNSLHDGVDLPRSFRAGGFMTDLVDVTPLATCRMYATGGETWRGFLKNAGQGIGSPRGIVPWTVLLIGGHVLPWVLVVAALLVGVRGGWALWLVVAACGCSGVANVAVGWRFGQGALAVMLRPVGVLTLVGVQWAALGLRLTGWRPGWKGRTCG